MKLEEKSTVEEIRARFDADVERFSNLETGQVAALDSPLHMQLIAQAAAGSNPHAGHVLDIGCGAGNYTLKLLQHLSVVPRISLVDLSRPMLARAVLRICEATRQPADVIQTMQGDIRDLDLPIDTYDVVIAAQCLHHLREDDQWQAVFAKVYASLRPGGTFWISDTVAHDLPVVHELMWEQWRTHLVNVKDEAYRDHVTAYVLKEDTPRSLAYQLSLLREVGFVRVDVLHKRGKCASFGGLKAEEPAS